MADGEENYEDIDADDNAAINDAAAAHAVATAASSAPPAGGQGGRRSDGGGGRKTARRSSAPAAKERSKGAAGRDRDGTAPPTTAAAAAAGGGRGGGASARAATLRNREANDGQDLEKQFAAMRKEKCNRWKHIGAAVGVFGLLLVLAIVGMTRQPHTDAVAGLETAQSQAAEEQASAVDTLAIMLRDELGEALAAASETHQQELDALKTSTAAEYAALVGRYELLEASAAFSVDGTSVAFRAEVSSYIN